MQVVVVFGYVIYVEMQGLVGVQNMLLVDVIMCVDFVLIVVDM